MPLLLWFSTAFGSIVTLLTTYVGKQIAIVTAAIIAFGSIILTFKIAIETIIGGLISVVPSGFFLFGIQLLPGNTSNCLTAIATAYTAAQIYVYWRNIIAFRLTP